VNQSRTILFDARGVLNEHPARLLVFTRDKDATTALREDDATAHLVIGSSAIAGKVVGLRRGSVPATLLVKAADVPGDIGVMSFRVDQATPGGLLRVKLHSVSHARELGHLERLVAGAGPDWVRAKQSLLDRIEDLGLEPGDTMQLRYVHAALRDAVHSDQASRAG
jgi:hypothetical protein